MAKLDSSRSEAGEAKQRKASAGAAAPHEGQGSPAADEASAKERKEQHRRSLQSLPPALQRRRLDFAGVLAFATIVAIGVYVTTQELLQPSEAPLVRIAAPSMALLFAMFLLSWLGVIVHGPGRPRDVVPDKVQQPLPPAVAAALEVGRLCKRTPFNSEGVACDELPSGKSVFFTYDSRSGQWAYMMEQRCTFAAQCVGYRNLRCFLVWLGYGYALLCGLFVLSVRRVLETGLPSTNDAPAVMKVCAWCAYMWMNLVLVNNTTQPIIIRTAAGWPSKDLWKKFATLYNEAKVLAVQLDQVENGSNVEAVEAAKHLREAAQGIWLNSLKIVAGPFASAKPSQSVNFVMGGPLSWRWLIPMVPSGSLELVGTCPEQHNTGVCQAWERLGQAMRKGQDAMASGVHSPKPGRRCKAPGFQQNMA